MDEERTVRGTALRVIRDATIVEALDGRRRRRLCLALLPGMQWNRPLAETQARTLAAEALQAAAVEVPAHRDNRVRALVDPALRRLSIVADLEA